MKVWLIFDSKYFTLTLVRFIIYSVCFTELHYEIVCNIICFRQEKMKYKITKSRDYAPNERHLFHFVLIQFSLYRFKQIT